MVLMSVSPGLSPVSSTTAENNPISVSFSVKEFSDDAKWISDDTKSAWNVKQSSGSSLINTIKLFLLIERQGFQAKEEDYKKEFNGKEDSVKYKNLICLCLYMYIMKSDLHHTWCPSAV